MPARRSLDVIFLSVFSLVLAGGLLHPDPAAARNDFRRAFFERYPLALDTNLDNLTPRSAPRLFA